MKLISQRKTDNLINPLQFIDSPASELGHSKDDEALLHEGCALKLASHIFQAWAQGGYPEHADVTIDQLKREIDARRLDHIPELRDFLKSAIASQDEANRSRGIYDRYVIRYFKKLIG